MEKFKKLTSKIVPIPRKDVDTDLIIPAQFLTRITREGFGEALFQRVKEQEADFPLNQQKYAGAEVIIADDNFGCGSSREHAVWAIQGAGFKVIIGKSFADIFSSNSAKNGLLLICLAPDKIDKLLSEGTSGEYELSIDLENQKLTLADGEEVNFEYDSFRKHCLLNGLDDIDYISSYQDEIAQFRAKQEGVRFYSTEEQNN